MIYCFKNKDTGSYLTSAALSLFTKRPKGYPNELTWDDIEVHWVCQDVNDYPELIGFVRILNDKKRLPQLLRKMNKYYLQGVYAEHLNVK